MVKCVKSAHNFYTVGKAYKVYRDPGVGNYILDNDGAKIFASDSTFKLHEAPANPMPELKAGMVVKIRNCGSKHHVDTMVYVHDGLLYSACGTHGATLTSGSFEVYTIYEQCHNMALKNALDGLENRLIWTATTPQQLKLQQLKEQAEQLASTIADLEAVCE